jgi:hypothetical protein
MLRANKKNTYEMILDLDTGFRQLFERFLGTSQGSQTMISESDYRYYMMSAALNHQVRMCLECVDVSCRIQSDNSKTLTDAPTTSAIFVSPLEQSLILYSDLLLGNSLQGLESSRYAFSTRTCIDSARVVLKTYCSPVLRARCALLWFAPPHCLRACITLHLKRLAAPSRDDEADIALLVETQSLFEEIVDSPTSNDDTRDLARHAASVLSSLLYSGSAERSQEPLTATLQRLVAEASLGDTVSSPTLNWRRTLDALAPLPAHPSGSAVDDTLGYNQTINTPGPDLLDTAADWNFFDPGPLWDIGGGA